MSKPKILFLITKSNWGGAQRYVYEMATAMKDDFSVAVGCGGTGTMREKLEASGVAVHEVAGWQRNVNLIKEWQSLVSLYRLLRKERPNVLHLNSSKAGLTGALTGRLAGVPHIVFTIHGWPFLEPRPWWWRALTWLGMYATAVLSHKLIPISQYDIDHAHMPGVRHKFHPVVHNAVPEIAFIPKDRARQELAKRAGAAGGGGRPLLLTIAELHPKKNIATAIKAVAAHNREHTNSTVTYYIIGDGVLKSDLHQLIAQNNATDSIALLGHVVDARQYLLAADMFVLPSFQEGLPYALLEAGAAGLPTIASKVCGIPEVITHQENGLLFNPHEQTELQTALTSLAENVTYRNELGTAFKETITHNFSIEQMIADTKAAYTR